MDLHARRGPAHLAALGQEPFDQLVVGGRRDRPDVGEFCVARPFEWDPAEAGDQRLSSFAAFDRDLKATARPVGRLDSGAVLARHLVDRAAVLVGQGLEQRGLHGPMEPTQT